MADATGADRDAAVVTEGDLTLDQVVDIEVKRLDPEHVVVRLRGELDMLTTPALRTRLSEELDRRPAVVVLDLLAVEFLGSSGLALLVEALEDAHSHGTALRLVCASRPVSRPLEATGLTELFDIYPDVAGALQPE